MAAWRAAFTEKRCTVLMGRRRCWAVGEEKEDWTFDADGYTVRHYNDVLTLQVWEHDPDMDGILIFEQDVSTEDENALREAFQAENDALWSGIR